MTMAKRNPRVQFYKDAKGEYRWRLRAANNKIIAESGEGYKTLAGVKRALDTVVDAFDYFVMEGEARG